MSTSEKSNRKYTIDDCHRVALNNGGTCLSSCYSSDKMQWSCAKSHVWSATFSHIKAGTWCPACYSNSRKEGVWSRRLKLSDVNERLSKFGMKFVEPIEYKNTDTKYKIECREGHVFDNVRIRHLLGGVSGCPFCNNTFRSENKFRGIIESIFKVEFKKVRPDWLKNPKTSRNLELDCYNSDMKLAFEYDGHFHFEVRKGINNNLTKTKELDKLKDILCAKNGVTLIRVPFYLKGEELYNKIIEGLKAVYGEKYWMVIREAEGGTPCPPEVKITRAEARNKVVRKTSLS